MSKKLSKTSLHRVVIYHDETQADNLKGHGLLFIPVSLAVKSNTPMFASAPEEYSPQKLLLKKLVECRQEFGCDHKLHFTDISGKKWKKYDYAYREFVELGVDALRHKSQKRFCYPLNCKMAAIFYRKGANLKNYGGSRKEKQLKHDEILLRMLLKGACHYLYDDDNQVMVTNIISDGNPVHRILNKDRIVWQLTNDDLNGRSPLRDYVSFTPSTSIIHLPSNHKQYQQGSGEYMHANFLQITDMLLGSIWRSRNVATNVKKTLPRIGEESVKKDIIAQPVREILNKKRRGSGFRYSSHYKSFTITQVDFGKESINFQEFQTLQIQEQDSLQMEFIFNEKVLE